MNYKKWIDFWLENYIKPSSKDKTYWNYKSISKTHIINRFGQCELNEITPMKVQEYINDLMSKGNKITNRGLSINTINLIITILQSSIKTAYLSNELKAYNLSNIRRPHIEERNVNCFSLEEQKNIEYFVLHSKKKKMLGIIICLYTGLRIGELLALTWDDIDLEKRLISVTKTCHDGKNQLGEYQRIINSPKTFSSRRTIPFPKQLLIVFETLKELSSKYVISNNKENISIRSYQRSFTLLLKRIGIKHKGFHSLRHTFATRSIEYGMDVKTLSEILGHKNAAITLNRYVHSLLEHKKEMMDKVGNLLTTKNCVLECTSNDILDEQVALPI